MERLAFFSDAVFAIAITLLVIEFRIPVFNKQTSFEAVWEQLLELKYKLLALCISFMLIANYWIKHHALFKHIHNYNRRIIFANLFVLLPVIFFPFSTAFFAEAIDNDHIVMLGLRLFLLNHILANVALFAFYWLTFEFYDEMSWKMERNERLLLILDTVLPTITFAVVCVLTFMTRNIYILSGLLLVSLMAKRILKRVLDVTEEE